MKVLLSCDDGFETSIITSNDILFGQLLVEVCSLRKIAGKDIYDQNTPAQYSIAVKAVGKGKEAYQYVSSQAKISQVKSLAPSPTVYFFGFKTAKQALAFNELKEFSSKLSVMSLAFSNILGSCQSVLNVPSNCGNATTISQKPLEKVAARITEFYHETLSLLNTVIDQHPLSEFEKSTLCDVRRK